MTRRIVFVLTIAVLTFAAVEVTALISIHLARARPERFVPDWDGYVAGIDQETMDPSQPELLPAGPGLGLVLSR